MSKLNINKIGIVSRDYRNREKNGHRDFSYAFKSILTTLDEQACDSVLFSLYTINKRTSFNVESILKELKIKNIRTIFLEEFKDSEERIPLENVIYYHEKGQWREQRLTQKFAKGGVKNKVAESFKKEVQEERLFGNFTVLLCGETNIVNYKMATKKIEDQYKFSKILDKDINIILNPIHDKMTRPEMKLKRRYLSKPKRWVVSVWNKGRSDRNGKVDKDHKNPHGWDIYYDGMEKKLKPINHSVDNQVDIEIGIINLQ
tara:strand:- start:167 stop:943 length:777 start_codon:yes stop_codon:yes gene_type:complete